MDEVSCPDLRHTDFRPTNGEHVLVSPLAASYRFIWHEPSEDNPTHTKCVGSARQIEMAMAIHPDDLPAQARRCKICESGFSKHINQNHLVGKLERMRPEDLGLSPLGERGRSRAAAGGAD